MKRRSFIKTIAGATAGIPIAGAAIGQSLDLTKAEQSPNVQTQEGVDSTKNYPKTRGIGCGVPAIDDTTNGFLPGQFVCVHGAIPEICIAFILNVATHATLKQEKMVDYIATEHDFKEYYKRIFGWMDRKRRKQTNDSLLVPVSSSNRPLLKLPNVDLGDPLNRGWKDYVASMSECPPDILLLDGVDRIEMYLKEKKMASQLRTLAEKFNIPVVVNVPMRQDGHLRKDFEKICDMEIRFMPDYVVDAYDGQGLKGKFYTLTTDLFANIDPTHRFHAFSAQLSLQFTDTHMQFSQFAARIPSKSFAQLVDELRSKSARSGKPSKLDLQPC